MHRLSLDSVQEMATTGGFKMTPQRRVIIRYLESATTHPTADDVYFAVNKQFPMTSRATVYNTLHWLTSVGMLRERFEGEKVRYDPNCSWHHHFVCRECGKLEDVDAGLINDVGAIELPSNNLIESYEITVHGLCSKCRD